MKVAYLVEQRRWSEQDRDVLDSVLAKVLEAKPGHIVHVSNEELHMFRNFVTPVLVNDDV